MFIYSRYPISKEISRMLVYSFPMTDLRAGKVVSDGFLSEFVRAKTQFSAVPVTRSGTL